MQTHNNPFQARHLKKSRTSGARRPAMKASVASLATIVLTLSGAHAVDRQWVPATGDFNDGANWNAAFVGAWNATADNAVISNSGTSTLSTGSATVGQVWVGQNAIGTGTGIFEQTGGALTLSDGLVVGRQGTAIGTFNMTGGNLTTRNLRIGGGTPTAQGTVTVSGASTVLTTGTGATGAVVGIGSNGTGTFTLSGGATWNAAISNVFVGGDNNASGSLGGTATGGTGTLNIQGGAMMNLNNINLAVGRNGKGNGTLNVTDGGVVTITLTSGDPILNLGNINGTATVAVGDANPVSTVTLSGATSAITVPRVLTGLGTVTINFNGGTFTTSRFSKGTGTTTIHFNGTKVKAAADQGDYFSAFTSAGLDIMAGGLIFDTNGKTVGFSQSMSGTGNLTKAGAGMLTFWSPAGYTGDTTVAEGTLQIELENTLSDTAALKMTTGAFLDIQSFATETVSTFYIDGVQQAAGTWGPEGSGADHITALVTGNGILQVTTGPAAGSPFTTWATTTKGLVGSNALPAADPDADGYNNLAEFILGGEPNPATAGANSNALAPTITTAAGGHVYSFRRTQLSTTQAGLSIGYQYGSDLTGWTAASDGTNGVTIVPVSNGYGSGIDRIDVTIPDARAVGGKLFVRLNAVLTTP
jgi:hypothetical protein